MESSKRMPLPPGYHAEPGPTPGHQHDVYTTISPFEVNRSHVGTLSKDAVEAWASSPVEMATALLFALEHDDDKDVADFLRDWMSGDTSRWFEFKPKYRATLAEKAKLLAARPAAPDAQGAWQEIDDEARNGSHWLVARVGSKPVRAWFEHGRWWMHGCGPHSRNLADLTGDLAPTHYQPLPAPPASSGQKD